MLVTHYCSNSEKILDQESTFSFFLCTRILWSTFVSTNYPVYRFVANRWPFIPLLFSTPFDCSCNIQDVLLLHCQFARESVIIAEAHLLSYYYTQQTHCRANQFGTVFGWANTDTQSKESELNCSFNGPNGWLIVNVCSTERTGNRFSLFDCRVKHFMKTVCRPFFHLPNRHCNRFFAS